MSVHTLAKHDLQRSLSAAQAAGHGIGHKMGLRHGLSHPLQGSGRNLLRRIERTRNGHGRHTGQPGYVQDGERLGVLGHRLWVDAVSSGAAFDPWHCSDQPLAPPQRRNPAGLAQSETIDHLDAPQLCLAPYGQHGHRQWLIRRSISAPRRQRPLRSTAPQRRKK